VFVGIVLVTTCAIIRVPFLKMLSAIKEPFLIAFSTANSESALPKAMRIMERFGVPRHVVAFVMPTGYSFNLDGSTLYLAMATLFIAQMAGMELSLSQQVTIMLTLMLTSKGIAAVPRASLVVLASTLAMYDLPIAGVAVILGIDHFLDMGRTSVNLVGNCVATAVVARWEGVFDDEKMRHFSLDDVDELDAPHLGNEPPPPGLECPQAAGYAEEAPTSGHHSTPVLPKGSNAPMSIF
jgi:proton glutamate symport protein